MRLPKVGEYWKGRDFYGEIVSGEVTKVGSSYEPDMQYIKITREDVGLALELHWVLAIEPAFRDYPNTEIFRKLYPNGQECARFWRVNV